MHISPETLRRSSPAARPTPGAASDRPALPLDEPLYMNMDTRRILVDSAMNFHRVGGADALPLPLPGAYGNLDAAGGILEHVIPVSQTARYDSLQRDPGAVLTLRGFLRRDQFRTRPGIASPVLSRSFITAFSMRRKGRLPGEGGIRKKGGHQRKRQKKRDSQPAQADSAQKTIFHDNLHQSRHGSFHH